MGIYSKVINEVKFKVKQDLDKKQEDQDPTDYTADNMDDEEQTPPTDEDNTPPQDEPTDSNPQQDDEDPTDYTADNMDDEEQTPPTDEDNQDDPPTDDGGELQGGDENQDESPKDGEEDSTDYTADNMDDGEAQPTDGDNPDAATNDGEGGDSPDYTSDNMDDGEDPTDGDNPDDPNMGDGGEGGGSELQDLENQLFSTLTPEQLAVKHTELKSQFVDLYNSIDRTINRINNISKKEDLKVLEFITKKLTQLQELVNVIITKTYKTKTYIENEIDFQHCLAIYNTVNKILEDLVKKNKKDDKK